MKPVRCDRCKELVHPHAFAQHTLDACKAAGRTYLLIEAGFRPFPVGNTLPAWLALISQTHETRGAYEGEPREEQKLLTTPVTQYWLPRWVDIIVELWAGATFVESDLADADTLPAALNTIYRLSGSVGARRAQRNVVLEKVLHDKPLQQKIVDAYREDLRAVRDLLRPHIVGPPPTLYSEHAAKQRG